MPPTTILIRHADITAGPGDDAPLNAAGKARAQELRRVLGDARIGAIFVSTFRRTQETAAPLAADLGLDPLVPRDVAATVAAIRALPADAVALVVGHTSTLAGINAGLGGPALPAIDLQEFDHLFVRGAGSIAHLRYGA